MNITEYKSLYQDMTAFFGVRDGVPYSGFISADGNPIYHYGVVYQGLGTAQEKSKAALGPYLALPGQLSSYTHVEAPVMQRNPRAQWSDTLTVWGFDTVKGFEDKAASKMRGTNMPTLDTGELVIAPRATSGVADMGIGGGPAPSMRWSDRMHMQTLLQNSTADYAAMGMTFRYGLSGSQAADNMTADAIQLDGTSRIATLTYCKAGSPFTVFEVGYFKVVDINAAGAVTEVGKVSMNNTSDGNRCHIGYSIPLDESLIERDVQGNATAYHLFYGKQQSNLTIPGKLIYKKINLRPWLEPAEEILIEDITAGAWPSLQSGTGTVGIKVEGRAFSYTHADIKYLVVCYKMGRHATSGGANVPFTLKRAVVTNGVVGAFETFTFPTMFTDYGNAMVLSPNRKTMWHYTYTGTKIACFQFGATVTVDVQDLMRDTYITAIGVDDNQCLVRTDGNAKLIIRPGVQPPSVTLNFDKGQYAIGDTALLSVTTSSPSPIQVKIEVTGATEKVFTKTVSASAPATISLTVAGLLQACMVN